MTDTLEQANETMRAAVKARLDATPKDDPKMIGYTHDKPVNEPVEDPTHIDDPGEAGLPHDWILRGAAELKRELDQDLADVLPMHAEGTTAKFGTGAVRSDSVEAFRYDLVSPIGLREVARTCAEGAGKYGDWNWEKGMPVHDLLNHAIAHIYGFLSGDRSEPHLGHAAWNLLAAIHSAELWPHLNDGNLRSQGCRLPASQRTP